MNDSMSPSADGLFPISFTRHNRRLRALLIEQQAWFVVRDLGKLLSRPVPPQIIAQLDADQRRHERLVGVEDAELLVSESGLYALLLIYCYHAENRSLRQWLSNDVLPVLRDSPSHDLRLPRRRMEQLLGQSLSVLDWQGKLWVRWGDAVRLMEDSLHS